MTGRTRHRFPAGTVTFLFSDLEGSTEHLREVGDTRYAETLAAHRLAMRQAFAAHGGIEVDTQGDAFLAVFPSAGNAVASAVRAQHAHTGSGLRVRIGLHTGQPLLTTEGYVGIDVHRGARIAAAAHGGQILASESLVQAARDEIGSRVQLRDLGRHRLKDLTEAQLLFQVVAPGLADGFPRPRTVDAHAHNLPVQLSSLIGREAELAATLRLLDTHRLVTLTGTGGTGKTRLALQTGAESLDAYRDGVWFVDLAPLEDPALVPIEVAAALGIREEPSRPIRESVVDATRARQLLVILDNCEHVVESCATLVNAMLRAGPEVSVLATSREPLRVTGEATYRVPSLALPRRDATALMSATELLRYEAVQLFVERAQAARPDVTLTPPSLAAAAAICRRLDGIPLAIELAAARARSMSIQEIDARLDDRYRLLTAGSRASLPRQQTLRALIDWSYDLLDPAERTLFARLAVFAGSWDIALAEEVCSDDAVPVVDVMDVLLRLTDKSLVVVETDGPVTTYRMLDTLRAYAAERLGADMAEAEWWRRRHLDAFVQLAESGADGKVTPSDRAAWLTRTEAHLGDLRAAQATALQLDPPGAVRLAGALVDLWVKRGHLAEGREVIEAALAGAPDAPEEWRARALLANANVALSQSRYEAAIEDATRSIQLADQVGVRRLARGALTVRGLAWWEQGELEAARLDYRGALDIAREVGDREGAAALLTDLGLLAGSAGKPADALRLYEEAAAAYRDVGDDEELGSLLNNIAVAAETLGDLEAARTAALDGIEITRRVGNPVFLGYELLTLAHIELALGDLAAARRYVVEGLSLLEEQQVRRGIAYALEYTAMLAQADDDARQAMRLLGAAASLRSGIGSPHSSDEQRDIDRVADRARGSLGSAAATAAFEAGRTLTEEEAIVAARAILERS